MTPEEIEKLYDEAIDEEASAMVPLRRCAATYQAFAKRFAALVEAKALEEREALERRRDAWLAVSPDRDVLQCICADGVHLVKLCIDPDDPCALVGEHGPDYWQALRAALDEAQKASGT
jgi:hypothetical protein